MSIYYPTPFLLTHTHTAEQQRLYRVMPEDMMHGIIVAKWQPRAHPIPYKPHCTKLFCLNFLLSQIISMIGKLRKVISR